MSKEIIPITEFPVAAALPEYLPAEQIGVDVGLIGKVARWGCFRPDVQISAYYGSVTNYDLGIDGMVGPNLGSASATGKTTIAQRSEASFEEMQPAEAPSIIRIASRLHPAPRLNTKFNIAEIQQRLQDKNAILRDPAVWAKELNGGMGEALRQAARQHILNGSTSYIEAIGAGAEILSANIIFDLLDISIGVVDAVPNFFSQLVAE
ncbi:MAG TPA: hypothetical protein VJR27_03050 [Candidatus Saccharimonadales bacterium]|nr:hypothetical protein [Candidatus Saccharimonadales bacterium]